MSDIHPPFREDDADDLYENSPCGHFSTLVDGTIVRVNQTFLTWTGLRTEDVVGRKRFQDLLTPGGRIFYETHHAPLLRMQGEVREIAVDFACTGDRLMPALINSTVKRDRDGNVILIRTAVFHATDRREYERELLSARQRAEESETRARMLAQTLQSTFIPPAPPTIPGLGVGAIYRPAGSGEEVGGDFYDVFQTARGRWAVVIGDVCGKGAEAATITALARHTVQAAAIRTRSPMAVLHTLNEALLRHSSERFCTVLYAAVRQHPDGRFRMTLASGGHPLPLHAPRGQHIRSIGHAGTILGVVENPELKETSLEFGPEDVVAFYTDGVTEGRRGDDFFGEERLVALVARHKDDDAASIARHIVNEVVEFQANEPRDDVAVVTLKVPPQGEAP
ncbi:MAG TPA: SpoIIE family protein phosphatase [Actinomycetota bacterium]|nr:SpoIIE family protein phosphatase [Actinomycetota bacterium]